MTYGRIMGKLAINTSVLTVALTIAFSLVVFFSNSWFNRVTEATSAFERHKIEQVAVISTLEARGMLLEQKYIQLETRLEKMDGKLDKLLERR